VHGFLGSSNWNTRIAAGQAVNAIARNVPQWQPPFATKKGLYVLISLNNRLLQNVQCFLHHLLTGIQINMIVYGVRSNTIIRSVKFANSQLDKVNKINLCFHVCFCCHKFTLNGCKLFLF